MKKVLGLIAALLILFIILMYWSLNSSPEQPETSILANFDDIEEIDFTKLDSVSVAATTQYKSNELKRLMQGEHYRKAWSTPIKAPVMFLDTLKVIDEGGGKQTKSLELEGPSGIHYTLRGINKNPAPLVPEFAKTLGLENIVVDGISAQHPYGAVVVSQLADAVGILHTKPKIVFVPKQDALEGYSDNYGNKLFLFEYETESKVNWTNYQNVIEIVDTDDLQELKQEHGEHLQIDQNALVRARLFDIIIGDWDRHAKQWGWVLQLQGKYINAIPLPADRDNAFFNLGGVIPNIISNKNVKPEMRPFDDDIDYLPGLVQPFDVYFLQNISEDVYIKQAKILQDKLTDEVIENALRQWPKDIYDLDAEKIATKLKSRRDHLVEYAKGFKKVLDKKPLLTEPLKGSEDLNYENSYLLKCFECIEIKK
ncbi:hypothetical protein M0G43_13570 [Subsaxibacter sp. CAU 1640]|uniref:hypothetical protein n=1 Tax=Subsaxibacter sp. CAU 1640 TaxID=2933271 RepID=UPI002005E02E|nr:hypothetical protein [Subsaxibacter sp. CAU 1640]MCK7591611.1 hypothetical protein [Subsaxibacter sp. CAU 1640]